MYTVAPTLEQMEGYDSDPVRYPYRVWKAKTGKVLSCRLYKSAFRKCKMGDVMYHYYNGRWRCWMGVK